MQRWIAAAALTFSISCFSHVVRANGKTVREERDVRPFSAVSVASGIRVVVEPGAPAPLEIEGAQNLLAVLETTVEGDTLRVRFRPHTSVWDAGDLTVRVRTPELRAASASGGAHVEGRVAAVEQLELEASGGAEIHLRGIDSADVSASGSGGAVIELAGRAERLAVEMSGGTHVKTVRLAARKARISGSGGSEAEISATDQIRGDLSGGSELTLRGPARARVKTSGGSEIHYDDDDD